MHALVLIDERLRAAEIRGGIVLWIHDEFLLEVDAADAPRAAETLVDAMVEAFLAFLPNGPVKGLVSANLGRSWAETK
jgi:DNA polymerase I-like protein with 3'-5' exonuclease and polymerase domains